MHVVPIEAQILSVLYVNGPAVPSGMQRDLLCGFTAMQQVLVNKVTKQEDKSWCRPSLRFAFKPSLVLYANKVPHNKHTLFTNNR